jgi:hypothetical protein
MQNIDRRSLQTLQRAMVATAIVLGCILLIAARSHHTEGAMGRDLLLAFTASAIAAMVAAMARGERAGRGPLNGWDESLAFNGIALLVHVLQHVG